MSNADDPLICANVDYQMPPPPPSLILSLINRLFYPPVRSVFIRLQMAIKEDSRIKVTEKKTVRRGARNTDATELEGMTTGFNEE